MMMRNKKLPPNSKFTLPDDFWEVRAAKRVLTFVPPDSDLARRANLLIDDPVQLVRETPADNLATARPRSGAGGPGMGRAGIDALVARLVPGTLFRGNWALRLPMGAQRFPIERRKQLAALKDKFVPITLVINTRDPATLAVTATLRAADRTGAKRELKGEVMEDRATGRAILYFPHVKETEPRLKLLDTDFDLFTAPESLTMVLSRTGLIGKMPGPVRPESYWFELECTGGGRTR